MESNRYLSYIVVIAVILGVFVVVDTVLLPMIEAKCPVFGTGYNAAKGRCNPG
ncbi:MAG TPA: hypothetical protein VF220_03505 [Nitrososphaeraceae archaeon]